MTKKTPAAKLLPCPFCGAKAKVRDVGGGFEQVYCLNDSCWACSEIWPNRAEALAWWNRRAK